MNRRFTLTIVLVAFVLVLMVSSPMPMGEVEQDYDEDMPDLIKEFASSEIIPSQVYHIYQYVAVAATTGDIAMGHTFDRTKTFFMWSMRPTTQIDDDDNYCLSLHWKDNDEITWKRDDPFAYYFYLSIWAVEFTSGIEVWELGPFSSVGVQAIGDTVVMADTFVLNDGHVEPYGAHDDDWPVVYLSSTTQITVTTYDSSATWSDFYVQVVEGADLTVQRGISSNPSANPVDITVSAVTIARTQILLQSATAGYSWRDSTAEAYLSDTTSLMFNRYDAVTTKKYYWQLVEWPEGTTVQHIDHLYDDRGTSETVTITEVDTDMSMAVLEGTTGASQIGVMLGMASDEYGYGSFTTIFTDSTTVTVARLSMTVGFDVEMRVCVITWSIPNDAPVNDVTPTCTNMDDTDNLYARYKLYEFSVSTTDAQGYADIDYVELSSYDTGTTTLRWTVRFDEDTNTFTEEAGATYITESGSTYDKSGINLDITFKMYIEWAHPDAGDDDLYQYVVDDEPESDADSYDSNYDYETRLDFLTYALDDGDGTPDRGTYYETDSITASGTVIYYGSGDNYPASGEVDVWVHCVDVTFSPWSDLTLTSGVFSMTVDSDEAVGLDSYWFKVLAEGTGPWGADLCHVVHWDTYIADKLIVTLVEDTTTPLGGTAVNIDVTVLYDYDDTVVSSWSMMIQRDSVNWETKTADFSDTNIKGVDYVYDAYSPVTDVGGHGVTAYLSTASNEVVWQNNVPVNDQTPICINPDDTDNLYAHYKLYEFSVSVTDDDGYADINYIELRLYDYGTTTLRWTVRYTESTNAFTEESGASYIELTGSTYNKDGNNLDVTFKLYVEWVHLNVGDEDLYQYVIDGSSVTDTDSYDSNYDFETRTFIINYGLDDGLETANRGNYGAIDEITASGTVIYFGSSDNWVPSDQVDIWVSCADIAGSPWSDLTLVSGVFSMTVDADDIVGLDTYTFKTVLEGAGSGGADQNSGTTTETYIADKLIFTIVADDDTPLGGVQATFTVTAIYDYDDTTCSTYDVWISRGATNQWTEITSSPFYDTNVKGVTYTYDVYSVVSEGTYGITVFTSTGESVTWGNNFPVNDVAPSIANPDDTDNLYARYKWYYIAINVSDPDGYADIDYAQIYIYLNDQSAYSFVLRFDEDTNTFSEIDGLSYVELDTGTSSYVKSGNDLDITFVFKIEWSHADLTDTDTRGYVIDVSAASDSDFYETNWDIETRLDFSAFSLSDGAGTVDRGNYDTLDGITASGTVIYYTSADNYPASGEVDIWVLCGDVAGSPWSDLVLVSGAFSMTVDSDDIVGLDTYTFKAVLEGTGSGGTDQLHTTHTDTYIADRIRVSGLSYGGDVRVDVGTSINFDWTLIYEYDSAAVSDGTVTINGQACAHQGSGVWRYTSNGGGAVGDFVADTIACSGNVFEVDDVNQNGNTVTMVWDRIQILTTTATVSYLDYGTESTTINVTAQLEYTTGGAHSLGAGDSLYLNDTLMTWDTDHFYIVFGPYDASGSWLFYVNSSSANEATYAITIVNLDGNDATISIDRIKVMSYAISDARDNVGDRIWINVTLQYESDSSNVVDGTVTINGYSFNYIESGIWNHSRIQTGVIRLTFDLAVVSGNARGIVTVNQNSQSQTATWDRIKFLTIAIVNSGGTDVTHGEVSVGEEVQVRITAELEYDNYVVGAGGTLYLLAAPDVGSSEWFALSWDAGNNWWEGNMTESSDVKLWIFSAHSHDANEATYDITAVNTNSIADWVIWDRIQITNIWITDGHVNADSNSTVWITCEMEWWLENSGEEWLRDFNGDEMYLNGTLMTYDDEDRWYIDTLEYSSGNRSFIVTSGLWDVWDITEVENATYVYICWDRVEVTSLSINIQWTVVGYNATIAWTADYEISTDTWAGDIVFNGTTGTRFPSELVYGNWTFTPVSSTDPSEGITVVLVSDTLVWCIFDDADISSVAYYWVQYSIDSVWLIWMSGTWTWAVNGTTLDTGTEDVCKIRAYMNGTDDDWGIINGAGQIGDLIVGEFDTTWYFVNLTINCETTISGTAYDWQVWDTILDVDILHSIHIQDSGMDIQDVWVTFIIHTNWGNASFTIWDNDTIVGHSGSEGWYQIAKPSTVGLHNYTVLINGTHGTTSQSGQTKDFSLSDSWAWRNFKYTVNPVALEITNWRIEVSSTEVAGGGYISKDADVYIYEDPEKDGSFTLRSTTAVSGLGTFSFYWTRYEASESGDVRYAVKFVNASSTWWENGTYARAVSVSFAVDAWWLDLDLGGQSPMVEGYVKTSWENATIQVYDNNTLQVTVTEGAGGVFFYWWMSENQGLHEITLNITSGGTTFTKSRTYYVPDWAVSGLVVRWDMWTYQNNYTLLTLESNWRNCTYHVYLNGSEVANATVDPVTLNFTRAINFGEYNLTIFADGGTQNYTILNIRYIVTEEGVTYDYSEVTTSHGVSNNYETNNFATYENPTGFYASSETVAMIIVGILLGAVVLYLIVSRWLAVWRAKFAAKYS